MPTNQVSYTQTQISAWLRGLISIAMADNDYSEQERSLFDEISHSPELGLTTEQGIFEPISPDELATALGEDVQIAQNFLRTAVMMALADGHYTDTEDATIQQFCVALKQEIKPLLELRGKLEASSHHEEHHPDLLEPIKEWLDRMEVHDNSLARFICKVIPAQCPFERDVSLFGRKIMHIPAMCKINPLYDQLVGLRFRSLSYLADKGEDISSFY
ncbi:Mo-dependent nitrogenase C-terminal domain-containing protein [Tumidithrix elongata RA019]|uniref:Mo-dependent nitrogenase C-terminal domain-containing protein n=1 Tax=Tumidithrix elongata BACA0141 TaxID=2716417 RepID=A0AAW9Q058_9CYAN|nr:Mo-dependent nitrogenase C-terminal domain-containing protein [Tumidithrix elongata RA019]